MDKRTLLALSLSLLVFVAFDVLFFSEQRAAQRKHVATQKLEAAKAQASIQAKPGEEPGAEPGPKTQEALLDETASPTSPDAPIEPSDAPPPEAESQALNVSAAELSLEISTRGATLSTVSFNNIKDQAQAGPFAPLHDYGSVAKTLGLTLTEGEGALDEATWAYRFDEPTDVHVFSRELGAGRRVEKRLHVSDSFHVKIELRFVNSGERRWDPFSYTLNGPAGMVEENKVRAEELQGVWVTSDPNGSLLLDSHSASSVRDSDDHRLERLGGGESKRHIAYAGLSSKYFASLLVPMSEATTGAVKLVRLRCLDPTPTAEELANAKSSTDPTEAAVNQLLVQIISRNITVEPEQTVTHRYHLFCGPKSKNLLNQKPYSELGLYKLFDYGYGIFKAPAKLLSGIFSLLYLVLGNYGFAIVLMTLMIKGIMHPLSRKQHTSMHKMQKLQPELTKLREKYEGKSSKEAKEKMAMEQMTLYRKAGVNPLAGCLPMFIHIPVFFALYNVLNSSYELRQAPFMLWINDLSQADQLMMLPFEVPFHGTRVFSVLPIIMIVLYFLQTRFQPKSADPKSQEMQNMMKFMLPVFGFLFYTVPSGLLLYFITNSLVSMLEMIYIRRLLDSAPPETKIAPALAATAKSKTKTKRGKPRAGAQKR
jgi:YidC/Oxa1 family membrane protein insertase